MKLSRPVKAWAHWNTVSKGWWAWHGDREWAVTDPCYIVPARLLIGPTSIGVRPFGMMDADPALQGDQDVTRT